MKELANILKILLYGRPQKCGPNHEDTVYMPALADTSRKISSVMPELVNLVPDNCFHPRIRVCIDFTSQFAKDVIGDLEAKRPLSKEVFTSIAKKLVQYVAYYFEYILSYGNKSIDSEYTSLLTKVGSQNYSESSLLEFTNNVINYFLTDISVDRAIGQIGSCVLTFRDNQNYGKQGKSTILFDKTKNILNQLFAPMLPIMCWASGRMYKDWYFPLFDGFIMSANQQMSAGYTSLIVNCKDQLELARISTEMINPALIQAGEFKTQNYLNIFAKPLYNQDHMKIIKTMFLGGEMVYDSASNEVKVPTVLYTPYKDKNWKKDMPSFDPTNTKRKSAVGLDIDVTLTPLDFSGEAEGLKFSSIGEFYPIDADDEPEVVAEVLDRRAIHKDSFSFTSQLNKVNHIRKRGVITWGGSLTPYRIWNQMSPSMYTSEFSSRLQIIQDVAATTYFNFYIDGDGNFHYHPMRLANNYFTHDIISKVSNPKNHEQTFPYAQVIGLEETTQSSSIFNIDELTTFLRLSGQDAVVTTAADVELNMFGIGVNLDLMSRFGYRRKAVSNLMFNQNPVVQGSLHFLDIAAYALLDYMNAELYTRQATIIFRPELELASPVFFVDDQNVFYVQAISHSINIGGDAVTSINGNFGRKDQETPADLYSFMLITERQFREGGESLTDEDKQNLAKLIPGKDWIEAINKIRGTQQEATAKEAEASPYEFGEEDTLDISPDAAKPSRTATQKKKQKSAAEKGISKPNEANKTTLTPPTFPSWMTGKK